MKKIGVILGLFGLNLLYFSDTLTGRLILSERDLTTFFYPFRYIWVETLRRGHFPFWNPYIKCGVPLFATLQPGVLYPLSFPYLFLPLDQVFNWTIILHFFLAAVFTYLLMREIGASMLGGAAAALAFLFSGYLISVHNVLNTLLSVSLYPLVVFCGCWLIRDGRVRWAVATGLGLCCMFLAGGIEIVIFALASLLLLCCYPRLLNLSVSGNSPRAIHRLALLALSLIIFLGLSMIQFLPSLELYRYSSRYGGVSLEQAMRWSLPPSDLIYFLIPDLYGPRTGQGQYWVLQNYLKTIYAGPIVFFLSGFYFYRQGRRALPLLAAMGTVLILALGDNTPLYPILYKYFPMFSTLRYPVKFLFLFVFSLSVTAGLGLDALAIRFSEKRRLPAWARGFFMAAVLVLAGLLVLSRFYPDRVMGWAFSWWGNFVNPTFLPKVLHNLSRLLVVATLGLIVIFFGLQRRMARMGSALLLVLLVSDLFLGNRGFAVKLDAASFHATTDIIRALNADSNMFRFHVRPKVKDVEVVARNTHEERHRIRKEALAYDLMMEHHLYDIDGYNVPIQPRYERIISLIRSKPLTDCRALLDLLNVKYVLMEGPVELPGYVLVQEGIGTTKLYENRNHLPRAYLVGQYQILKTEYEFGQAFTDPNFNPRQTVILEQEPTRFLYLKKERKIPDLEPAVKMVIYESNRIMMKVSTPEAALLFMSETYYPGWKAYVDGKEEEILRANYTFRAIPVGPGSHRIEVVCQPTSFKVGLTISLLTIVALLTAGAVLVRKRQV